MSALPSIERAGGIGERLEQGEGEICARLGEGARAIADRKIADWKREEARRLIEAAMAEWLRLGLCTAPMSKAIELAEGPHSSPARVEAVLADISGKLARKDCYRPLGYLINGLGLNQTKPGKPAEIPLQVAVRWQKAEDEKRRALGSIAAIQARIDQVRQQQTNAGATRAGTA